LAKQIITNHQNSQILFQIHWQKHDVPGEREARESRQRRVALIRRLAKAKQEATGETGSGDAATGTLWMLMEEMLCQFLKDAPS